MSFVAAPASQNNELVLQSQGVLIHSALLNEVPGIVHGFTTRYGGVSQAPRDCLNLGRKIGDPPKIVNKNRSLALSAMGVSEHKWVSLTQVHGKNVVEVTPHASKAIEADGLWTRSAQAALAVTVADCVPLLFAHRSGLAVGAVHAGWRGTVAKIALEMVHRFKKAGFAPEELVVAMGPAIGPCCFEIGSDVLETIEAAFPAAASLIQGQSARGYANLWDLNRLALQEAGLAASQIDVLQYCTFCSSDFFSYRRDHGSTGRQAAMIARV